jgi:hypothetical protein
MVICFLKFLTAKVSSPNTKTFLSQKSLQQLKLKMLKQILDGENVENLKMKIFHFLVFGNYFSQERFASA